VSRILKLLAVVVVLFIGAELIARYYLGLGTPPLSIAHPRIEYMFAPNQSVYRFGNKQAFNEFGMRSEPIEAWGERDRVIVLGDSVINGGNLTDQDDLATSLLTDDTTVFGNASAGSWGPANMRAWVEEFGLFDANKTVVVLSSHDLTDIPTFEPLNEQTHPVRGPVLAVQEGITRYLPRYFPALRKQSVSSDGQLVGASPDQIEEGILEIEKLIAVVRQEGAEVCVVKHMNLSELSNGPHANHKMLLDEFDRLSVPVVSVADLDEWAEQPSAMYRDDIHINERGQRALAGAIRTCAERLLAPQEPSSARR